MGKKIFIQCSNCGFHFEVRPMCGICEGMYYSGNRAVGSAFYCEECVKTWKDRNGRDFDDDIENPSKQFVNWWNNKVRSVVADESKIKTYRIVDGIYEEVPKK